MQCIQKSEIQFENVNFLNCFGQRDRGNRDTERERERQGKERSKEKFEKYEMNWNGNGWSGIEKTICALVPFTFYLNYVFHFKKCYNIKS